MIAVLFTVTISQAQVTCIRRTQIEDGLIRPYEDNTIIIGVNEDYVSIDAYDIPEAHYIHRPIYQPDRLVHDNQVLSISRLIDRHHRDMLYSLNQYLYTEPVLNNYYQPATSVLILINRQRP